MRLLDDRLRRLEQRAAERRRILIPLEREDPDLEAEISARHPNTDILFVVTGVPANGLEAGSRLF
jgi:hypothetical protein